MDHVYVAMSGGIDSTVAAIELLREGMCVTGVTMRLGIGLDDISIQRAESVCRHLGISHEVVDLSVIFGKVVIEAYARAYASGITPNPCVECNTFVKFRSLRKALPYPEAVFATGHYARIIVRDGRRSVVRGVDAAKDQSYFLYRLGSDELDGLRFPIGGSSKSQVRDKALEAGFEFGESEESQDACFTHGSSREEILQRCGVQFNEAGSIKDQSGKILGMHSGLARYTVGQRRGIGVAHDEPLYVVRLDVASNTLIVGQRAALACRTVVARDAVWRLDEPAASVDVQLRYRATAIRADASFKDGRLTCELEMPLEGVAPGQALVCYKEDVIVGGGVIEESA